MAERRHERGVRRTMTAHGSKSRLVTRAVPDVKNLNAAGLLAGVVEDAIGMKDDLTQRSSSAARLRGANEWKRR